MQAHIISIRVISYHDLFFTYFVHLFLFIPTLSRILEQLLENTCKIWNKRKRCYEMTWNYFFVSGSCCLRLNISDGHNFCLYLLVTNSASNIYYLANLRMPCILQYISSQCIPLTYFPSDMLWNKCSRILATIGMKYITVLKQIHFYIPYVFTQSVTNWKLFFPSFKSFPNFSNAFNLL